ncbi:MAG: CPBP family intramembrane metalloprotease [Planctomycetes bacterium]|nr:CPBP family intramembrane metalloprotease [Planctomycetota bacterium]
MTNSSFGSRPRPGSVRSAVAAWVTILAGCAWMLTDGFGLLKPESAEQAPSTAPTMVSPQADAAIQMVVAMKSWAGAEAIGAGMSSLDPLKTQGTLERLAFAIAARWMGDEDAENGMMQSLEAERPQDALVQQVKACLAQAETIGSSTTSAPTSPPERADAARALPEGVTRESLSPLGASASLLESMATGDAALGAQVAERATRIAFSVVGFFGIALVALAIGVVTLVMLSVKASSGAPMSRLAPTLLGHQGIHIELFAAWVVYEVVLGVVASRADLGGLGTLGVITFQALGLVALAWPILRGMSWGELRRELGLTMGAGVVREAAWGVLAWCMAVPMVLVGLVLSLLLGWLFGGSLSDASHPLQEGLRSSSAGGIVIWYLVAAVVAPVLEEILFRGGLYRGLRGATGSMPLLASMVVSALLSSFVFAAIHPQGVLFVPILGALAMSFCLVRELRGSLVAPMVGHALNNGLIVTLNLMLLK